MREWFENKTVALIGNAMSLFDSEFGLEIDEHDVVVRLNRAAMLYTNFDSEKSHGKRTDVWMFWNVTEYRKYFSGKEHIKKMHMGHQSRTNRYISECDFVYPNEVYTPLKVVAGSRKNPTTGFMAIDWIIRSKPKVLSIYGFDWKETPTFTDPTRSNDRLCPHNHDVEKEYVEKNILPLDNVILKINK